MATIESMFLTIKKYLRSRKIVLSLILFLFFSVLLSYLIPQQFSTPKEIYLKWQEAHQAWLPLIDFLDLDHLFTASWFAVILFAFFVSLALATYDQLRVCRKKTSGNGLATPLSFSASINKELKNLLSLDLSEHEITKVLLRAGYFKVEQGGSSNRYVKHPWGYWGNFFLHLGILVVIASSLMIVLTEKRGVLRILEGEMHLPQGPWLHEDNGLLAGSFVLPEAFRLDKVQLDLDGKGDFAGLKSAVSFISPQGVTTPKVIDVDENVGYGRVRIFQQNVFGNVFYLELSNRNGEKKGIIIDIKSPFKKDQAGYGEFNFEGIPFTIKAKYFADADKKTLKSDNPLLILKLLDDGKAIGRLSLQKGWNGGRLGPYGAELLRVTRWTEVTFVETTGMAGIFFGFFIIVLGSTLNYFTIPREIHCQKNKKGFLVQWKGTKFTRSYSDEGPKIIERLKRLADCD